MGCSCEFSNVGHHEQDCKLQIVLIKRLEAAKERVIKAADFESAAAVRDAILFIREKRSEPADGSIQCPRCGSADIRRGTK